MRELSSDSVFPRISSSASGWSPYAGNPFEQPGWPPDHRWRSPMGELVSRRPALSGSACSICAAAPLSRSTPSTPRARSSFRASSTARVRTTAAPPARSSARPDTASRSARLRPSRSPSSPSRICAPTALPRMAALRLSIVPATRTVSAIRRWASGRRRASCSRTAWRWYRAPPRPSGTPLATSRPQQGWRSRAWAPASRPAACRWRAMRRWSRAGSICASARAPSSAHRIPASLRTICRTMP
jgi:hypothetical protein